MHIKQHGIPPKASSTLIQKPSSKSAAKLHKLEDEIYDIQKSDDVDKSLYKLSDPPLSSLLDFVILSKAPPFQVSPEGEVSPLKPITGVTHYDLDVYGEEHSEASKIPEKDRRYFQVGDDLPDEISYTYTGKRDGHFYDRNQLSDDNFDKEVTNLIEQFDAAWKEYTENERKDWVEAGTKLIASKGLSDSEKEDLRVATDTMVRNGLGGPEGITLDEWNALGAEGQTAKVMEDLEKKYLQTRAAAAQKRNETINRITDKLGTSLMTQAKRTGWDLHGEKILVDANAEYSLSKDWEEHIRSMLDSGRPDDWADNVSEADIALMMDRFEESVPGSFNVNMNRMIIGPESWGNLSLTKPNMFATSREGKEAYTFFHTLVHETLHSRTSFENMIPFKEDMFKVLDPDATVILNDDGETVRINPLPTLGGFMVEALVSVYGAYSEEGRNLLHELSNSIDHNIKLLHDEFPQELSAIAIMFQRYHSDRVGDFSDVRHQLHGYGASLQAYAHWALAINDGDGAKALAFTQKHRALGEGGYKGLSQQERKVQRQKLAAINVSFGAYLAQMAKTNSRGGQFAEDETLDQRFVFVESLGVTDESETTTRWALGRQLVQMALGLQKTGMFKELWQDDNGNPAMNLEKIRDYDFIKRQSDGLPDSMNLNKKYPPDHPFWKEIIGQEHVVKIGRSSKPEVKKSMAIDSALSLFHDMLRKSVSTSDPVSNLLDFIILSKAKPLSGINGIKGVGGGGISDVGGGAGGGTSPGDREVEQIPKEDRIYVDRKEDAPDGVEVHVGPDKGLFYDKNDVTEAGSQEGAAEEKRDGVFDDGSEKNKEYTAWLKDYARLLTDVGSEYQRQVGALFQKKMDAIEEEVKKKITFSDGPSAGYLIAESVQREQAKLDEHLTLLAVGEEEGDIDELERNLAWAQDYLNSETQRHLERNEEYQSLKNKRDAADPTTKMRELRAKIGAALVEGILEGGFELDGNSIDLDPDMTYDTSDHGFDEKVAIYVKSYLLNSRALQGLTESRVDQIKDLIGTDTLSLENLQEHMGPTAASMLLDIAEKRVKHERMRMGGVYTAKTNQFVMSYDTFKQLVKQHQKSEETSKTLQREETRKQRVAMLKAMGTLVHESLHSVNRKTRQAWQIRAAKHAIARNRDISMLANKHGMSEEAMSRELTDVYKLLFEEAPTELLAKSIVGRRYNPELVGQNPYASYHGRIGTDDPNAQHKWDTFTEGRGAQHHHEWHGYPEEVSHVGRWALGLSGGDPVKARALLTEMRDLTSGKGIIQNLDLNTPEGREHGQRTVRNLDRTNELLHSFGTHMQKYVNQYEARELGGDVETDQKRVPLEFARRAARLVDGLIGKEADRTPLVPNMMGWGLESDDIILSGGEVFNRDTGRFEDRPGRPLTVAGPATTISDEGYLVPTDSAHLDLMHLVYGTEPIEYRAED
tara:strand:- start:1782 stop:6092 length:4311 start_codon:yes stop_codon:yes gene_type:complete